MEAGDWDYTYRVMLKTIGYPHNLCHYYTHGHIVSNSSHICKNEHLYGTF